MFPVDIIIRVDAKKENDSGEYTFQCKALGELVRCGECKNLTEITDYNGWCPRINDHIENFDWFCADGERKESNNE